MIQKQVSNNQHRSGNLVLDTLVVFPQNFWKREQVSKLRHTVMETISINKRFVNNSVNTMNIHLARASWLSMLMVIVMATRWLYEQWSQKHLSSATW